MRAPFRTRWRSLAVVLLAACGKSNEIPDKMAGGYLREEPLPLGVAAPTAHLYLTPTGISVTGPGIGMSESMKVAGLPALHGEIKLGTAGSVLFTRVRCDGDRSCSFQTRNECDGTITRDARGDIVIVVMGECTPWAGKWFAERPGETAPKPGCPPIPTCSASAAPPPPSVPPGAPSGFPFPFPSGFPSAEPSPSGTSTVQCMLACNAGSDACVRECKVGQTDCMRRCSDATIRCVEACQ